MASHLPQRSNLPMDINLETQKHLSACPGVSHFSACSEVGKLGWRHINVSSNTSQNRCNLVRLHYNHYTRPQSYPPTPRDLARLDRLSVKRVRTPSPRMTARADFSDEDRHVQRCVSQFTAPARVACAVDVSCRMRIISFNRDS